MAAIEDKSSKIQVERCSKSTLDPPELPSPSNLTPEEEARLWRKIDIQLMPILALLYLFTFLDRGAQYLSPLSIKSHPMLYIGNIG